MNGIERPSYALLVEHDDLTTKYDLGKGMIIAGMQLDISPEAIINGSFNWSGENWTPNSGAHGHTVNDPVSTSPMSEDQAINDAWISYVSLTYGITGLQLTTQTPVSSYKNLGDSDRQDVKAGAFRANGKLSVYLNDDTWDLRDKLKNRTAFPFGWALVDGDVNRYMFYMPEILFTGEPGNLPGQDERIFQEFDIAINPALATPGNTAGPTKTLIIGRVQAA